MKKWVVRLVVNRTYACVVEAKTREEAVVKAVDGDTVSEGGRWSRWTDDPPRITVEAES